MRWLPSCRSPGHSWGEDLHEVGKSPAASNKTFPREKFDEVGVRRQKVEVPGNDLSRVWDPRIIRPDPENSSLAPSPPSVEVATAGVRFGGFQMFVPVNTFALQ